MNSSTSTPVTSPSSSLSDTAFATKVPAIATFVLFVFAALIGGDIADRDILTLVRFISLVMLALGLYTAFKVGRYCAYSRNRWRVGQAAAGFMGLAAGFVWSATAYGFGFIFFMVGILTCALLFFKEMEKRTNRFLARKTRN